MLLFSAALICIAAPFRLFKSKKSKRVVFFYQMHGNALALSDYISENDQSIEAYFLAFPQYLKIYKDKQDLPTLNMFSLKDMIVVAKSDVIVTNYGALTLVLLAKLTNIKFVDVFHGILFLKFAPPPILHYLNDYEEVWVSSSNLKRLYVDKFGVTSKIVPTGYGRVDKLINGSYRNVREKYEIPLSKKIIMIAPTWKHNDPDRSLLPYGMDQKTFLAFVNKIAEESNTHVIYRAHMLSENLSEANRYDNVKTMPSNDYPDTEELLSIVDLLVTDWSSLAFDFMVLDRPVIFIDTKPPFTGDDIAKRSNPSGRFGEIISNKDDFRKTVKLYIDEPEAYLRKHRKKIEKTKEIVYGGADDGKATERYYERLINLIG